MSLPVKIMIRANIVHHVIERLHLLQRLEDRLLLVVDDFICTERFAQIDVHCGAASRHMAAGLLRDLDAEATNTARAAVEKDSRTCLHVRQN